VRTVEQLLRRAHEGLGHPERERFLRILTAGKAKPEIIEQAKQFKCSVCEQFKVPRPARKAAPPREWNTNYVVGVDTVNIPKPDGTTQPALNIIDWGTHFQLVIPLKDQSAGEARKAYRVWLRFFGPPKILFTDLGREFDGAFISKAEADGTEVEPSSLETPTQRGMTERAGQIFKTMLAKAMITHTCESEEEWRELVDVTCVTKNRLASRGGYSPIQRVLSFLPRLPGGLLSEREDDHATADL
jgi:hypothetical protein